MPDNICIFPSWGLLFLAINLRQLVSLSKNKFAFLNASSPSFTISPYSCVVHDLKVFTLTTRLSPRLLMRKYLVKYALLRIKQGIAISEFAHDQINTFLPSNSTKFKLYQTPQMCVCGTSESTLPNGVTECLKAGKGSLYLFLQDIRIKILKLIAYIFQKSG